MRSHLAVAALLGAVGCGTGERSPAVDPDRQPRREAMQVLCAAEQRCCKDKERNNFEVAVWIETNVVNPAVIAWIKAYSAMEPSQRAASFRAQLAAVKIPEAECPIFASWTEP